MCFERPQQFAIVLGQQRYIGAAEFHVDQARFQPLGIARAIAGGDAVLQAHPAQLVKGSKKSGDFLCSLLQVFDWHNDLVSQNRPGVACADFDRRRHAASLAQTARTNGVRYSGPTGSVTDSATMRSISAMVAASSFQPITPATASS